MGAPAASRGCSDPGRFLDELRQRDRLIGSCRGEIDEQNSLIQRFEEYENDATLDIEPRSGRGAESAESRKKERGS
jgi:hypothetical protein